ncbi:POLI [Symbiodinium pilosum]|uniref:POLI protein n=1 Tax=Symbiodinium pilosum TaxID=2952 RepID=A0A812RYL8_SYMPI|nr:POLI [Symbiodinium pilosum]
MFFNALIIFSYELVLPEGELSQGDRQGLDDSSFTSSWIQLGDFEGISVSKQLAKMVSSWKKPSQQTLFLPTADRLGHLIPDDLAVQKIPGIGFSSTQKLQEEGIKTTGEILAALDSQGQDYKRLLTQFDAGSLGTMRALCLGMDASAVKSSGAPKTCSVQDSFWQNPVRTDTQVKENLLALAQKLLTKVRSDERMYGYRPIPTFSLSLLHAPSSEASAARRGRKQMQLGGFQIARRVEEQADDERLQGQIADRAFALFRKLVPPQEPFVLHILNLQVGFGEALGTQRRLSFNASQAPALPSAAPIEGIELSDSGEETVGLSTKPEDADVSAVGSDDLASLTAMGFAEGLARQALAECGDVPRAVEKLLARPTPHSPSECRAEKRRRLKCSVGADASAAVVDLLD